MAIIAVYNTLTILSLWSHMKTMLTDPGAVVNLPQSPPRASCLENEAEMCANRNNFVSLARQPRTARPLPSARDAGIPETICGRCDAYKPPRSHHCRICQRCIVSNFNLYRDRICNAPVDSQVRMDHHCPWMNNCIGALNQKHFMLFLVHELASFHVVVL